MIVVAAARVCILTSFKPLMFHRGILKTLFLVAFSALRIQQGLFCACHPYVCPVGPFTFLSGIARYLYISSLAVPLLMQLQDQTEDIAFTMLYEASFVFFYMHPYISTCAFFSHLACLVLDDCPFYKADKWHNTEAENLQASNFYFLQKKVFMPDCDLSTYAPTFIGKAILNKDCLCTQLCP